MPRRAVWNRAVSEWRRRRSWKCVKVSKKNNSFSILLDDRTAQTPGGKDLVLPTRGLADRISGEWQIQKEFVEPGLMPFTQRANTALDCIGLNRTAAVSALSDYASSDLICYRADGPDLLAQRQRQSWDPIVAWADQLFSTRIQVGSGIMPIAQPRKTLSSFRSLIDELDDFALTAFAEIVALSGSLLIGLAVIHRRLTPNEAWDLSRIDEQWQTEHWGEDAEAHAAALCRCRDFLIACEFAAMARPEPASEQRH